MGSKLDDESLLTRSIRQKHIRFPIYLIVLGSFLIIPLILYSTHKPVLKPQRKQIQFSNITLNSTLGFQKLFYLELPSRHDRMTAMALQASILNITY